MLVTEHSLSDSSKALICEQSSHLSLNQYEAMSTQERSRLQTRVRQWALKARAGFPKDDHGLFCLVAAHLLKNAHRYFCLKEPSDLQMRVLEGKILSETTRQKVIEEFKEANRKLRVIGDLKCKNRITEQQNLVDELKGNYHTYRNLASMSGISLKTVHSWCTLPKEKKHKGTELSKLRRQEFEEFLKQDSISFCHPSKKYSGKRFLRDTFEVIRSKYLQQTEFHKYGIISMSTMKHYRPSNFLLCGHTPLDQCLCDRCENCEQLLRSLHALGLKNIPSNRYAAINSVVCTSRILQRGSKFSFPHISCINGLCSECGESKLREIINENNTEILTQNRTITWRKWMKKPEKTAHEKIQIRGTVKQAVTELLEIVKPLKSHIFRSNWNRNLFDYMKTNLRPGYIVQIFDFAMNFRNIYQDEVQSAYWNGTQTAIHAVINYFLCPIEGCRETVTLILGQITDDPLHDSFVARAGHECAFKHLAELDIPMENFFQFCDNCSSQYKSRRPFAEMARCPLDLTRIYFGEKHGKGQCDGFFGRLKAWMTYKIKARHVIITNAHDFFRCCKEEYETPPADGNCQHYRVAFQYLRPSDIRRHQDCDLDKHIEGTREIYCVRNTPLPLKLKVRKVPCLCPPCISENGEMCENAPFTDPWREVDLIPVKGENKRKHQKRKHPKDCISIRRSKPSTIETEHLEESGDEELPDIVIENAQEDDVAITSVDRSATAQIQDDLFSA